MGQRQVPFGPEISWPGGYTGLEYRDGDYRYPGQPDVAPYPPQAAHPHAALPASPGHGEHPYAAYGAAGYGDNGSGYAQPAPDSFGYGDPGYSNPGYDGPSAQDSGVAATRMVRGFVEPGHSDPGPGYYGAPGHEPPSGQAMLPAPTAEFTAPGYGQPAPYAEPWDYSQPLRYDSEEPVFLPPGHPSGPYPIIGGYSPDSYSPDSYGSAGYGDAQRHDAYPDEASSAASSADAARADFPSYRRSSYDPASYNGSELSRPGIDGLGYDLSEIIGTKDFPAYGYDEPSVERLSYDDPRYDDGPGDSAGGSRYDGPRFDETRLDGFWGGDSGPERSGGGDSGSGSRRAPLTSETRLDLGYRTDRTRFDMPSLSASYDASYDDETRLDNRRALDADRAPGRSATGLLAPARPAAWADETSLDSFAGLDFDDMPGGYYPEDDDSRAVATALQEAPAPFKEDAGSQRSGRRRGRSSDRRQWLALGAVVVVAAGAITYALSKFVFPSPSGPAHTISTPTQLSSYTRSPSLEKAVDVQGLREKVIEGSSGQASDVLSAVYAQGNVTPGAGGSGQMFMFVGGHLANSDPASSIASFEQTYPGAQVVPAGALGGTAACTTTTNQGESMSMCVFFDNDSFGTLVSPSMTTAKLASTMATVRPGIEQVAR